MKKIIVFAANGFIGESLLNYLKKNHPDYTVTAISRKPVKNLPKTYNQIHWDGINRGKWCGELENADLVINLAGKSVNCRYNAKNKAEIFASRLDTTRIIGEAIQDCINKPKCWMNMASATIYEHSLDEANTETNGIIGSGFSVNVCKAWEKEFFAFKSLPYPAITSENYDCIGKKGGVFPVLKRLAKIGLGGKMGNGKQLISWIHIDDFCRALVFLFENPHTKGVYNLGSPNPVRNESFQKQLRKALTIPYYINQPVRMLQFGAWFLGTETELVLKSRNVFPEKLLSDSFSFEYPTIELCFKDLCS